MEITKEHFDFNFIKANYKSYIQECTKRLLSPKEYLEDKTFMNINQETLISGEIANYVLMFIAGFLSMVKGNFVALIAYPLSLAISIYFGSFIIKIAVEYFDAPKKENLYYRNFSRIISFYTTILYLFVEVLPFNLMILTEIMAIAYSIYLTYIILCIEFKVSEIGKKIIIGVMIALSVSNIVRCISALYFINFIGR